jgi:predicted Na+-dependent transporter
MPLALIRCVMPLIAILIGNAFQLESLYAAGLILMACIHEAQ